MQAPKQLTNMIYKILFLGMGVIMALQVYDNVYELTGDSFYALIAFVATLSFWIGTLTVIFKWIFKKG